MTSGVFRWLASTLILSVLWNASHVQSNLRLESSFQLSRSSQSSQMLVGDDGSLYWVLTVFHAAGADTITIANQTVSLPSTADQQQNTLILKLNSYGEGQWMGAVTCDRVGVYSNAAIDSATNALYIHAVAASCAFAYSNGALTQPLGFPTAAGACILRIDATTGQLVWSQSITAPSAQVAQVRVRRQSPDVVYVGVPGDGVSFNARCTTPINTGVHTVTIYVLAANNGTCLGMIGGGFYSPFNGMYYISSFAFDANGVVRAAGRYGSAGSYCPTAVSTTIGFFGATTAASQVCLTNSGVFVMSFPTPSLSAVTQALTGTVVQPQASWLIEISCGNEPYPLAIKLATDTGNGRTYAAWYRYSQYSGSVAMTGGASYSLPSASGAYGFMYLTAIDAAGGYLWSSVASVMIGNQSPGLNGVNFMDLALDSSGDLFWANGCVGTVPPMYVSQVADSTGTTLSFGTASPYYTSVLAKLSPAGAFRYAVALNNGSFGAPESGDLVSLVSPPGTHSVVLSDGYNGPLHTGYRIFSDLDPCLVTPCSSVNSTCINAFTHSICVPVFSVVPGGSLQAVGPAAAASYVDTTSFGVRRVVLNYTDGGSKLQFSLPDFGAFAVSIAYGPDSAPNKYSCLSVAVAGSMVTCEIAPSVGALLRFRVYYRGALHASAPDWFGFAPPAFQPGTIQALIDGAPNTFFSTNTDLPQIILIRGSGWVPDPTSVAITYGPLTNTSVRFTCAMDVTRTTTTVLACTTQLHAYGVNLHMTVDSGGQSATSSDVISYPSIPAITAITGSACNNSLPFAADCPTAGVGLLTLKGVNFAAPASVLVAGAICANAALFGSDTITCSFPAGVGAHVSVLVQSTGQFSQPAYFSYALPRVVSVGGCSSYAPSLAETNCTTSGGVLLTIHAIDLGPSAANVLIGSRACTGVVHSGDNSYLTCTLPAGSGLNPVLIIQNGGQVSSTAASLSYAPCPPGTAGAGAGAGTGCTACAPGRYSPLPGSVACLNCDVGRYTNSEGAVACTLCAAGEWQPAAGMQNCSACGLGTYQSSMGQSVCLDCGTGTFANHTGAALCTICPIQTFAPPRSASCSACGGKTYSLEPGMGNCKSCEDNQYLLQRATGTCAQCPIGASCLSTGVIRAEAGYYLALANADASPTSDGQAITAYTCLPKYCAANDAASGTAGNCTASTESAGADFTLVSCCAPNRVSASQNLLCGACAADYFEWGGECISCPRANVGLIFWILLATFVYVCVFHVGAQSTSSESRTFLNFVQLLVLFFGSNNQIIGWMSILDFNVFHSTGPTCVAPFTPIQKLLTGLFMPVVCFGFLLLIYVMHRIIYSCVQAGHCPCTVDRGSGCTCWPDAIKNWCRTMGDRANDFPSTTYVRSVIALVLFSYNSWTGTVIVYFNCVSVAGDSLNVTYPAISCSHDDAYLSLRPLFIALLAVVVAGVPVFILLTVYVCHRLGYLDKTQPAVYERIRSRIGVLYEAYVSDRYWYECVVIVRRTILNLLANLISTASESFTWISVANLAFLLVHVYASPYQTTVGNTEETIAWSVLLITTIIMSTNQPLSDNKAIGLGVFVLFFGLGLFLKIVVVKARTYCCADAATTASTPKSIDKPFDSTVVSIPASNTELASIPSVSGSAIPDASAV